MAINLTRPPLITRIASIPRAVDLTFVLATSICLTTFFPFSQTDWPNPIPPRRCVDLPSGNNSSNTALITTTAGIPFVQQADFRNPYRKVSFLQQTVSRPGTSGQGFQGVGEVTPLDWPNPLAPVPNIALKTHTQNISYLGLDQFFGAPGQGPCFDWPNPRGPVGNIDLRTHINASPIKLIGQDVFFGLAGAPSFNQPNPTLAPVRRQDFYYTIAIGIETAVAPPPNFDYPNPRGAVGNIALRTHTDQTKFLLIGKDLVNTGSLTDWPNPRGYVPAIDLKTWVWPTSLNLLHKDKQFGGAGQWKTYDWPNPRGYQRSVDLLTWQASFGPAALPHAQFAGTNYDFPNPRGPSRGITLWTWAPNAPVQLVGKDKFTTGRQIDWPNPTLRVPPSRDNLTWIQSIGNEQLTVTHLAFQNYDWPNPRGPVANISLR